MAEPPRRRYHGQMLISMGNKYGETLGRVSSFSPRTHPTSINPARRFPPTSLIHAIAIPTHPGWATPPHYPAFSFGLTPKHLLCIPPFDDHLSKMCFSSEPKKKYYYHQEEVLPARPYHHHHHHHGGGGHHHHHARVSRVSHYSHSPRSSVYSHRSSGPVVYEKRSVRRYV